MLPIIILAKERPQQLLRMIHSIEDNTDDFKLIICDNNSVSPEAIKTLKEIEKDYLIIHNNYNLCFEGLNPALKLVKDEKYFLISDPDIIIKSGTPRDWPKRMLKIMLEAASPKVGLGLDTNFKSAIPEIQILMDNLRGNFFNKIKIDNQLCSVYGADTTMAIYRQDSMKCWMDGEIAFRAGKGLSARGYVLNEFNPKYTGPSLMLDEPFVAYHAPWTYFKQYDAEQREYLKLSNRYMSSMYYQYYHGKI